MFVFPLQKLFYLSSRPIPNPLQCLKNNEPSIVSIPTNAASLACFESESVSFFPDKYTSSTTRQEYTQSYTEQSNRAYHPIKISKHKQQQLSDDRRKQTDPNTQR